MEKVFVSASPHVTQGNNTTRSIMIDVLIALLPLVVVATVFYGYHVLINVFACLVFCFGTEIGYLALFDKKITGKSACFDCSCFVTAVILALNLPATMNVWGLNITDGERVIFSFDTVLVCLIGSIFAIAIVKQLFGGIGKNFINPALGARVFLLLCFGTAFTATASAFDATTSVTWLATKETVTGEMLLDMFLGNIGSSAVGESCVIALIVGYVYLVIRKVIDFSLPLVIVGSAFVFALIFDGAVNGLSGSQLWLNATAHTLSGGLIFGAVFMATDYATSPDTRVGRIIYGVGIALISVLIRCFAQYPEGVSFAIMIMNIATPLIDRIRRKPFGFVKAGK